MLVTIDVKDEILIDVIHKMVERSNSGIEKYGTTLKEDGSGLVFFLKQIQTELMDATLYLQRLKEEISLLREEKELLNSIQDIDVIDPEYVKPPAYRVNRGDEISFSIDEDEYEPMSWEELRAAEMGRWHSYMTRR
jgi:hypothetical protein